MDRTTAILLALGGYALSLLVLSCVSQRRTHSAGEFYLGGKTLGSWVTALAANASSSSAWSLLGTSGFAYRYGLAALWLLPGCLSGFLLNYLLIAPRLRAQTAHNLTLTEFLAGPSGPRWRGAFVLVASLLTLFSLGAYVAAQMQAAGAAVQHAFPLSPSTAIVLGALATIFYTLLGGYLAVSLTDTVQGLLMFAVAILVPTAAVLHLGGPTAFAEALAQHPTPHFTDLTADKTGLVAVGFVLSLCGIGLGYPGQPHAINKFMGMAPQASMRVTRIVGLSWAVVLYVGMILTGWAAAVAFPLPAGAHEDALFAASQNLLPPLVDGLVLAAVLAATMSTVDSQLLVCASCVTHDLLPRQGHNLRLARAVVLTIGALATFAAIAISKNIFDHVLFAWAALGSAFGPLLLVRLCRGRVSPGWSLLTLLVGGVGAIVAYYFPVLSSGFADRVLAFLLAFAVAWASAQRHRT